jgi:hypothetical protein
MAKLAPMSKFIIPSAFRLSKIIHMTYDLMLKITISHNIIPILKIIQVMVYISFKSPIMVTPLINPISISIIIVISPLYPI